MQSLDIQNEQNIKITNDLKGAIQDGDADAFVKAQIEISKNIQNNILAEAKSYINENNNSLNEDAIRNSRGLHILTAEETKYYNEVIGTGSFAGTEQLVPATIFDRVFEDLKKNHELLNKIQFVNTTGVTEWVSRNNNVAGAWWGKLCAAITKQLEMAFKKESVGLYKLSAYLPVCKAMLALGPVWLDRFVREVLTESIAIALEDAIIKGDGDDQPIGMIRDLEGAVVLNKYPEKTATALTSLTPKALGAIMKDLTADNSDDSDIIMIVKGSTYWDKIYPQTTMLTANGTYVYNVLPINMTIIKSEAVAANRVIIGHSKDYFMGVGSERIIDFSDHYRFLEDERTYITKQYANGKPMTNNSFKVYDVTDMVVPTV